jgi:nucleoside-diphosphate-sugar epimerase
VKVLVTGGAGFIGSSLAAALVREGHDVRILDNFSTGFRENLPDGADIVEGDLTELDDVRAAVKGTELVFHQAAIRSVPRSVDDPLASHEANATGTLNVLIAATDENVRRVVYASSSSVYGDPGSALRREDMPSDPISPYGASKLAGEQYCRVWTRVHGLPTVSLRYFNVFGPRQHPESKYAAVFPAFIAALIDGRAPEVHWDGEQTRDFTFIEDVVAANMRAAEAGPEADGHAFNIGAGRPKSVNEVLRSVADALGTWVDPERSPMRTGDVRDTLADITRAREILGWEPRAVWEGAVAATVDWFRTR